MKMKSFLALAAAGLALVSAATAATITENFSTDPLKNGWQVFGDTNLFQWDPVNQILDVTWDSSRPNSYFYHPLGTILGTNDDFSMSFDLVLNDYAIGVNPAAPQLRTGRRLPELFRGDRLEFFSRRLLPNPSRTWRNLTSSNGTMSSRPGHQFGLADLRGQRRMTFTDGVSSFGVVELPTNMVMRVTMNYTAADQTCVLTITTNGAAVVAPVVVVLNAPGVYFGDFHLDTFAVESYSGAGSGGSLLAHGTIGNVVLEVPPPPVTFLQPALLNGVEQVRFASRTNWNYILQSSADLQTWLPAGLAGRRDGRQPDFAGHQFAPTTSVLPGQRRASGLKS